jgi:streptogramin lyase/predicted Ser/Thr protein kinase
VVRGDEGREIAGFRIESEIGRGGMGVVYLAHQTYPERKVALKLLSPDLASDPAFRERFVHESNAAASIEHPNIVPVYGAGEADGQLYLAMRFIEGTDLGSLLGREGALSPERAARICAEIADALEAAHDRGLIHRDVKPGNILLDSRDRAYLTDFGLIRRTQLHTDLTKTGQFMGTIDYCAPEQIKGGEIDGRADVYSLGCVLFECLTGAPPFRRDTEVATIYAHLEEDVPKASSKRPGISPLLSSVARKAMAKRPEDRFATAGEMAKTLRGGSGPPPGRRGRSALISLGAVVALLGIGVAILASRGGEAGQPPDPAQGPAADAVPLNSLLQIDSETGEIVSEPTSIPAAPDSRPQVEVGEGGVWVLAGPTVVHVDPTDGTIVGDVSLGGSIGSSFDSIAVGSRTVWVGALPGIVRINPATDAMLRPVRLNPPGDQRPTYVALGARHAWGLTTDARLTRVDPQTGALQGTVDIGQSASALASGFDALWVTDDLGGALTRVQPDTLSSDPPIAFSGDLDAIAAGAGSVWILDSSAGVVTPVDSATSVPGSPIRVGQDPTDVAVGLGAVWVTNKGDGTISKIDPVTGNVQTFEIGGPVAAIAVDERGGTLWVVVAQLSTN